MYKFLSKDLKKDAKFQDWLNKDFKEVCKREGWNYLPLVHNNIGYAFSRKHDYDSALYYYNLAIDAYHIADDSVATIQVYARMAKAYAKQSNYSLGLIYQKKAIDLAEDNKIAAKQLAGYYNSMGILHKEEGAYIDALKYYFKALDIIETLNKPTKASKIKSNLGLIYNKQLEYKKAEEMYFNAVNDLDENNVKHQYSLAILYSNLGANYRDKGNFDKSHEYHIKALELKKSINKRSSISITYNNLGELYGDQGLYVKALVYVNKALKIKEEDQDKDGIVYSLNIIADLHNKQKNYNQAIGVLNRSIAISKEIGAHRELADAYEELSRSYEGINNQIQAFSYYKKFTAIEDSIISVDRAKKLAELDAIYQLDKKEDEIRLQSVQIEKQVSDIENQKTFIIVAIIALSLAVLALFSFIQSNRVKKRSNELLEASNQEIKMANIELQSLNEEVQTKNENLNELYETLDEKNRDITSSINYAKKIQDVILPTDQQVNDLFPNSFLLYQPKDIVSGDFYWMEETLEKKFFMAADCTGHGVPGAFMSLIGSSIFNQLVLEQKCTNTGEILTQARELIIHRLKQTGKEGSQKDGMDAALCMLDPKTNILSYTGANNPVYIVRPINNDLLSVNGNLTEPNIEGDELNLFEIKADSQPIGYYTGKDDPFTLQEIQLKKGDLVVISSDGYPDQFGGPRGKKYKYKPFKRLFMEYYHMESKEIENALKKEFYAWKGKEEQVDDICIIGVKV